VHGAGAVSQSMLNFVVETALESVRERSNNG
jgi:hypothetical protein